MLSNGRITPATEDTTFSDCLEHAESYCEQARIAARQRCFKTARALLSKAAALYKRAILLEGVPYLTIEERLTQIEAEMAAYSKLARGQDAPAIETQLNRAGSNGIRSSNNRITNG